MLKNKFDGLLSVKPYNAFAPNYFDLLNNVLDKTKNIIELNDFFRNFDDSFDQFKFFQTLIMINIIGYYNLNVVLNNGIQSNLESLTLNYKIPTGADLFNVNNIFNFDNECDDIDELSKLEFKKEEEKEEKEEKENKKNDYKCYRCGRKGHFISNCYAKTHINGNELK